MDKVEIYFMIGFIVIVAAIVAIRTVIELNGINETLEEIETNTIDLVTTRNTSYKDYVKDITLERKLALTESECRTYKRRIIKLETELNIYKQIETDREHYKAMEQFKVCEERLVKGMHGTIYAEKRNQPVTRILVPANYMEAADDTIEVIGNVFTRKFCTTKKGTVYVAFEAEGNIGTIYTALVDTIGCDNVSISAYHSKKNQRDETVYTII